MDEKPLTYSCPPSGRENIPIHALSGWNERAQSCDRGYYLCVAPNLDLAKSAAQPNCSPALRGSEAAAANRHRRAWARRGRRYAGDEAVAAENRWRKPSPML
jgi:hypothetical protein